MSLFSPSRTNAQASTQLLGYQAQTSIYGRPIPKAYGQVRIPGNVIWFGDWVASPIKQTGGKGGTGKGSSGGKGGSGGIQYDYKSAITIGLCGGPIKGIGYIWVNKIRLTLNSSSESFTIPGGGGTYTPSQASNFNADLGVGANQSYSVVANDYGSPGPVTLAGNEVKPLTYVPGAPGAGQYTFDPVTGIYTFNAADAGKSVVIAYQWVDPNASTDGNPVGSLAFTFFNGAQGQAPWGYLTTNHPDQALGYSTLAYLANSLLNLGSTGVVSNYSFEVMAALAFGAGIVDAAVAPVISDLLTNPLDGALFPAGSIGSLTELDTFATASGIFVSLLLDQQRSAASWIQDLLTIANCEAVWSDGLLKFRAYGDKTVVGNGVTFTPTTAPVYDLDEDDFLCSSGQEQIHISRPSVRDAYNQVSVEWTNRGNNYNKEPIEEKDDWAIGLYGLRPASPLQLHAITTQSVAQAVCNFILQRGLYIRNHYKFKVSAVKYCLLEPMDMVTLTKLELGLNKTPVRIISIQENDQLELEIECEEFPWGTATPTANPKQTVGPFGPGFFAPPGNVYTPVFFEPASEQVSNDEYLLMIATSGGNNWGGCDVYVSSDGTNYSFIGQQTNPATMGVLTAPFPDNADPDDSNTLAVDLSQSGGVLGSYTADYENGFLSIALIDQELISYRTATLTGPSAYNITHMRRGIFGTPIQSHKAAAPFVFFDAATFQWRYTSTDIGQLRYFKFLSFNHAGQQEQTLDDVQAYTYRIVGPRPPYPWNSATTPPPANDPLYNRSKFGIQLQNLPLMADGSAAPQVNITGIEARNSVSTKTQSPHILFTSQSNTGGGLAGGITLVVGVTAISGVDGLETFMCPIQTVIIPAGTNTNQVTFSISFADPTNDSGVVYISAQDDTLGLTQVQTIPNGATSFTITVQDFTGNPCPDDLFDHHLVQAKLEFHSGIWGGPVDIVGGGGTTLQFTGGTWGVNSLAGRIVSISYKADGSIVPLASCKISSNTADTLTLDRNMAAYIADGDIVAIRATATSATATSVTDSLWVNGGPGQPGTGLTVDENKGRLLWIISGKGFGQIIPIASNTATTNNLAAPFDIIPDGTSTYIIVDNTWTTLAETASQPVSSLFSTNINTQINNNKGASYIIQVLTVDPSQPERFSDEAKSPFREIYQPGVPGAAISSSDGYFVLTPDGFGNVTVDLANGLNQRLVLSATPVTILAPIFTGGVITAGGVFLNLYFDQDGTGGRATPTFTTGADGFGSDTATEAVAPDALTRTSALFTFHGSVWIRDSWKTGMSIS